MSISNWACSWSKIARYVVKPNMADVELPLKVFPLKDSHVRMKTNNFTGTCGLAKDHLLNLDLARRTHFVGKVRSYFNC